VEHHALHRDLGLEDLGEVPGNGLTLAVLVGREIQLVGVGEQLLQLLYLTLALLGNDVERFKTIVDVDTQARPVLTFRSLRDVSCGPRKVPDMPH